MKALATCLLLFGLCASANAAVVWDESVNGPLSRDVASPTLIVFSVGSNFINGSVTNSAPVNEPQGQTNVRDVITFTVPPGHELTSLILHTWTGNNTGFSAINAGTTSMVPSAQTANFFLAGIHVMPTDAGSDLMDLFVTRPVIEGLGDSQLDPGDYCYIIQQESAVITQYSLEFIMTGPLATQPSTWGSVKALYR
jgi:hypothetical protein